MREPSRQRRRACPAHSSLRRAGAWFPPDQIVSIAELREVLTAPIEPSDPRYRSPLEREARILADFCTT